VVAGIAQRRAKGGGVLNRRGEEERGRGAGLVGKLACLGWLGEMGQVANGPVKKKGIKI
jgi:hypothetical protein